MVDVRKEKSLIDKHIRQHNREAGEWIAWYEFLPIGGGTEWDDVYDEGDVEVTGRSYAAPLLLPTIYVEEREDRFNYREEARQPTQNIYVAMLYEDVRVAGLSAPYEYQHHLNDLFHYDGRWFKVADFHSRGRIPGDVVIGVQGYQVYYDQELAPLDSPPTPVTQDFPWPAQFPDLV